MPLTKVLYVRVDVDLHTALTSRAQRLGWSVADLARYLIREGMAAEFPAQEESDQ